MLNISCLYEHMFRSLNLLQAVLLHLSLSVTLNGLGSHGYQHALSLADKIATKWIQEAKELVTIEEGSEVRCTALFCI